MAGSDALPPSDEARFIAGVRAIAAAPAARGLMDDAAVLEVAAGRIVLTHDMIVEDVHFLSDDPPGDVAWKLVAVNLSDLAAKGADPIGLMLGYTLGDADWDAAFLAGLGEAVAAFGVPLLGGDTVAGPARTLGLTALGRAGAAVPARSGARPGDTLFVTGTIGDAGAGLVIARGAAGPDALLARYRRPQPRLAEGRALAPYVSAMMDVSDGLLIDAARLAEASGCGVAIDLAAVPLSPALIAFAGDTRDARIAAASAGDDYELLFAAPALPPDIAATAVGHVVAGAGITLTDGGAPVPLPARLGYQHAIAPPRLRLADT